jgi:hypothetical protein
MTTWYRKEQASAHCIAMSKQSYCHLREKRSIFYMSYCKKRRRRAYFLRNIPKGDDVIACESMSLIAKMQQHNNFDVAESSRTAGVQRQQFDHRKTQGRNNQIFHAVNQRMTATSTVDRETTATSIPWYVILQGAMTTKVDCNEGCEIPPCNNQQKNSSHCEYASN